MKNKAKNVLDLNVSYETLLRVTLFVVGAYIGFLFVSKIFDVFIIFLVSYILANGLRPTISWVYAKTRKKTFSVTIVYIVFMIVVVAVVAFILYPIFSQTGKVLGDLGFYINKVVDKYPFVSKFLKQIGVNYDEFNTSENFISYISGYGNNFNDLLKQGLGLASTVAGGALTILSVLIISFYISMTYDEIIVFGLKLFKDIDKRQKFNDLIRNVNEKIGYWLQGQLVLCAIIFVFSFVILSILRIPLSLPLALLSGVLEIIPNIGPFIALIMPFLVALANGNPYQYIGVFVGYVLMQQLENYLIVPKVMSKSVNLHPFIVLIAIIVGGNLLGPIGAVIAVPVVAILVIVFDHYFTHISPESEQHS